MDGTDSSDQPACSTKSTLTRRRILAGAVEFVDEHGLGALTMRALGAHLGVQGMTLYRQVPGRDALLDGMVEHVIDEVSADPDHGAGGWQDSMRRTALGIRRIALTHPEVFPLVATRSPAAPWIRPPLRSPRWIESFLQLLCRSGFTDEAAVLAYRAFSSLLLGHLLLEVAALGVEAVPTQDGASDDVPDDVRGHPLLRRLRPLLSRDHSAEEFDLAVAALISRLEQVAARDVGPGA